MGLLDFELRMPTLPTWQDIKTGAASVAQDTREMGAAAIGHAQDLGQRGVDFGRRAYADPEGTLRAVSADIRQGIDAGVASTQAAVSNGVLAGARHIGATAETARDFIPGDNRIADFARGTVTFVENGSRSGLGTVGGAVNGVAEFAGGAATIATYGVELAGSPEARGEVRAAVGDGIAAGRQAVVEYGTAIAADPGRIVTDARTGADAAWTAVSGAVSGEIDRQAQATAAGQGPETLGLRLGHVATYVVPVGLGARVATTGVRATEAAAATVRTGDRVADVVSGVDTATDVARTTDLAAGTVRAGDAAPQGAAVGAGLVGRADDTVTVFRVEGAGNERILIGGNGGVTIPEVLTRSGAERNLYLNFGDPARAQQFLAQRLAQFPDSQIKTFEVPRSFVDDLRANAVPEADRALFPNLPVIADPTRAVDQFGLSRQQIDQLRGEIIQGTGRVAP